MNNFCFLFSQKGYCNVLKINRFPNAECEGPPKGCGGGSQCSINAQCIDNSNSEDKDNLYNCVCNKGFKGDGRFCQRGMQNIIQYKCACVGVCVCVSVCVCV